MKKSNIVVLTIAAVVSVFLLGLWFFLGFNQIDSPLDLVVSVIWWVVIAASVHLINKVESNRREKIRSVYVGDGQLFNSESGLVAAAPGMSLMDSVQNIVENLDYGFEMQDFPEKSEFIPRLLVRTTQYKSQKQEDSSQSQGRSQDQVTWEGEVLFPNSSRARKFTSPEELQSLLSIV